MTQEALKLALECAERCEAIDGMYSWSATITAIKEALAQTQEPVVKLKTSNMLLRCHRCGCSDKLNIQIEYTAPPQRTEQELVCVCGAVWDGQELMEAPPQRTWVDLTDEQLRTEFGKLYPNDIGILELAENNRDFAVEAIGARHHWAAFQAGARAAEAKLKELNT